MKLITLVTTAFSITSLITAIPAFSQPMQSAVCTNSTNPRTEPVKIDDNCKVQFTNNSLIFYWSNGTKTLIEGKLIESRGAVQVKINGKRKWLIYSIPVSITKNLNELCLTTSTSQNDRLSETFCFITSSKKLQLTSGRYRFGTTSIFLYSKEGKFCWIASSKYGVNVQSLRSFSNFPNIYVVEYLGLFIYANGQNTISYAGADHKFVSRDKYSSPEMQSCLNSNKPYYYKRY